MRSALITIFILIFFLGCVSDYQFSPEKQKILGQKSKDVDGDGIAEYKILLFAPFYGERETTYESSFFVMQKVIIASQSKTSLNIKNLLDKGANNQILSNWYTFVTSVENSNFNCAKEIGITLEVGCEDYEKCAWLCKSKLCEKYKNNPEVLGFWIKDFYDKNKNLNKKIEDVENLLVLERFKSKEEKEILLNKINEIIDLTVNIASNPIFDEWAFGICEFPSYENEKLNEIMKMLGEYERIPQSFQYNALIKFKIKGSEYTELTIVEKIPEPINLKIDKVNFLQKGSEKVEDKIKWDSLKISLRDEYIVSYSLDSKQNVREDIFYTWNPNFIKIKTVSIFSSPLIESIAFISNNIYKSTKVLGFYIAIALVLTFWIILLFIGFLLFQILINTIVALFERKSLIEKIKESFGYANIYWKEHLILTLFLGVLGWIVSLNAQPYDEAELNMSIFNKMVNQNILGIISIFLYCITFVNTFMLIEDKIKALIIGRRYYKPLLETSKQANLIKLKKLEERLNTLKSMVESTKEIDVSKERELVFTLPIEKISLMVEKNEDGSVVKSLLEENLAKVEEAIGSLEKKIETFNNYYQEWEREIYEILKNKKEVHLKELQNIPEDLKFSAVKKFVNKYKEYAIKGETIVLKEKEGKEIVRELFEENIIEIGIRLKNDSVIESYSLGSKGLKNVFGWKIINYSLNFKEKLGEFSKILITGKNKNTIITKIGAEIFILSGEKSKIKDGLLKLEEIKRSL